jgi:hypothetical protein
MEKQRFEKMSLLLGSIKCFPISFTHLRQLRWLPDGAGIIMTNKKIKTIFKRQRTPWGGLKGTRVHVLPFLFSRNTIFCMV